ncbi:C-GCAxxG-C-C family protein [Chloroflexota bacterium]
MQKTFSNKSKEERLDLIEAIAESYQYQYGGCGQSVLIALQRGLDLPGGPIVIKAASYACSGMVRMGDMCGALFGAIMAIGLASGRDNMKEKPFPEPDVIDEKTGNPKSLEHARRFYRKFIEDFGGCNCKAIHTKMIGRTYDLGVPEEFKDFCQAGQEKCAELVGRTARLAAEAILEMPRR